MGARKPGPTCSSDAEPIDGGTLCRHRMAGQGPTGMEAGRHDLAAVPVSFKKLWAGYPSSKPYLDPKTGDPPKGFENQCAIKVSVALHAAGVELKSFRAARVTVGGNPAAIRAEDLAAWLNAQRVPGIASPATNVTGENWEGKINAKTGIVYFANYWARSGESKTVTGDHIDLWNGSRLTASGLEGTLVTVLRFGLGVNAGPGFSDLRKATTILFWEVR